MLKKFVLFVAVACIFTISSGCACAPHKDGGKDRMQQSDNRGGDKRPPLDGIGAQNPGDQPPPPDWDR